jgi:hypothetical protein
MKCPKGYFFFAAGHGKNINNNNDGPLKMAHMKNK